MWKLLFFVLLNGQPQLGLVDVDDLESCKAKALEMIEVAKKHDLTLAVRCVQIKVT